MDEKNIATVHNGGRIKFGPDGALYAVVGEHANAVNAQTVNRNTNLGGKVLRMTPDGGVPAGNPFPGSFVWAYGIRNSFGFTFDPTQGSFWLTDNGPSCNDEVNRIVKAGNYGWGPQATCNVPPRRAPGHQPERISTAAAAAAFLSRAGHHRGRLLREVRTRRQTRRKAPVQHRQQREVPQPDAERRADRAW